MNKNELGLRESLEEMFPEVGSTTQELIKKWLTKLAEERQLSLSSESCLRQENLELVTQGVSLARLRLEKFLNQAGFGENQRALALILLPTAMLELENQRVVKQTLGSEILDRMK